MCKNTHFILAKEEAKILKKKNFSKSDDLYLSFLVKICKYYFEDDLTQQEIAKRMRLSRPKVSRLLSEAKRAGIYQVYIQSPPYGYSDTERELEKKYGILEAVVTETRGIRAQQEISKEVGRAAGEYLSRVLNSGDTIAFDWGYTMKALTDSIRFNNNFENVTVVQMHGDLTPHLSSVHATEVVRTAAFRLGGDCYMLPVPGIVEDASQTKILESNSQVRHVFDMAESADLALVSVGICSKDTIMGEAGYLTDDVIKELIEKGAVGDIMSRFYDHHGVPIDSSFNSKVISLPLNRFKNIKRKVIVAGGKAKVASILGALYGNYVDILITGSATAAALLSAK